MRNAVVWTGAGLLAGATGLAVLTAVVNRGRHEDGLLDETGGWWTVSVMAAVLVLAYGIRWYPGHRGSPDGGSAGRAYVFWLSLSAVGGVYAAFAGFPADSFQSTSEAWRYDPSPAAVSMWLVVCMTALGCASMVVSVRPPGLRPLRRSLPLAAAGVLAVVLASGLVQALAFPREPHTTAGDPGDPAPVPAAVGRVGWSWAPPMGTGIDEVRAGTHGPLVLLDDGAVSLDGATGEELWSFRRPLDRGGSVWADDEHVYVRYARGRAPEQQEPVEGITAVLDIGTGEITGEAASSETGDEGRLVAVTAEARVHLSWVDDDGEAMLTARSLEGGEELWSYTPVTPGDAQACRHEDPRRYGDLLVTLQGCAPEKESRLGDGSAYESFRDLFWDENAVEVAVTAVDVGTGEEAWRHEWVADPLERAPEPAGRYSLSGDGDPVVALRRSEGDPGLLLWDAATGERLDHLPESLFEGERGDPYGAYGGVVQVDTAGGVVHEDLRDGSLIHRVDASGEVTATADAGDILGGAAHVDHAVALEDVVLLPRTLGAYDEDGPWAEVAVAPFGESVTWESARWIVPEGRALVDVLAVPGAVVVHTGTEREESLIEGLVP